MIGTASLQSLYALAEPAPPPPPAPGALWALIGLAVGVIVGLVLVAMAILWRSRRGAPPSHG